MTLLTSRRFLNKDLGFACGGSGSLFKTENGGKTWKREKVRVSPEHSIQLALRTLEHLLAAKRSP